MLPYSLFFLFIFYSFIHLEIPLHVLLPLHHITLLLPLHYIITTIFTFSRHCTRIKVPLPCIVDYQFTEEGPE